MAPSKHQFHPTDYLVFAASLLLFLGVGIYHNVIRKGKTTISEYFIGSRNVAYVPVSISLAVTYQSSILLLGYPAESYVYGMQIIIFSVVSLVMMFIIIPAVVPMLHPLRLTSVYEYLELRFRSRAVRKFAVILSILDTVGLIGIAVYGPALALDTVTGFPMIAGIFCGTLAATIYTCIGGFKTVVWTDVIQYFIMLAGIVAILVQGTLKAGGVSNIWKISQKSGRLDIFNFDPDPTVRQTFWSLSLSSFAWSSYIILNQSSAQRMNSIKTTTSALRMMRISNCLIQTTAIFVLLEGIVAYAYFEMKKCDPFKSGHINNPNQLIPYFILDIFQSLPGMPGLFVAALYSASLSTVSSGLSSLSVSIWKDIICQWLANVSQTNANRIAKLTVILVGVLTLGTAFIMTTVRGNFMQLFFASLAGFRGPLVGIFCLGCFCPRSTAKGALVGASVAFVLASWISIGQNFSKSAKQAPWLPPASTDLCPLGGVNSSDVMITYKSGLLVNSTLWVTSTAATVIEEEGIKQVYRLSFRYLEPLSLVITMAVGLLVSYFTGMNRPSNVDPRYLISVTDTFLPLFPKRVRQCISSIGPQFMKEEYKALFPDPAQNGESQTEGEC